eukprot:scaffold1211_cov169-Amphora_coffeaeformis.AAC.27
MLLGEDELTSYKVDRTYDSELGDGRWEGEGDQRVGKARWRNSKNGQQQPNLLGGVSRKQGKRRRNNEEIHFNIIACAPLSIPSQGTSPFCCCH